MIQPLTDTIPTMTIYPDQAAQAAISLNVWEICSQSYYLIYLLLVLLLVAVYVFVERIIVVGRCASVDSLFMQRIKDFVHDGEVESAENLCRKTATPASRVTLDGLALLGHPLGDINGSMLLAAKIEKKRLSAGKGLLLVIAIISPIIGFMASVFTMAHAMGSGEADVMLSSGIFSGLVALLAGLIVSLVSFVFYFVLKSVLKKADIVLHTTIGWFTGLLNEPLG